MQTDAWLNQDDDFTPGRVLFRSERTFDGPRIDVLFKPVVAIQTGMVYDGLVIRCATPEERSRIVADAGESARRSRVHILENSDGRTDYVISAAVGWATDNEDSGAPSSLAFFFGATDPARILPTEPS
ncbi:hypothetical protein OG905_23235 [Streptomyces sp. NBC_00322]|uniref:hypothetical protein n=1 Tax=Streptomyces sp. NBC_00322 TaxID=2975712 RepID=UPI002E2BBBDE|nr:hypothetical protein [Streptomyces sp. NBC_00322]